METAISFREERAAASFFCTKLTKGGIPRAKTNPAGCLGRLDAVLCPDECYFASSLRLVESPLPQSYSIPCYFTIPHSYWKSNLAPDSACLLTLFAAPQYCRKERGEGVSARARLGLDGAGADCVGGGQGPRVSCTCLQPTESVPDTSPSQELRSTCVSIIIS